MQRLISEVEAVRSQLSKKQQHVKGHKQMRQSKTIMAALASQDQDRLALIPGPLKYGLLIEFSTNMAEQWLEVFRRVPSNVWTRFSGRFETTKQDTLVTLTIQMVACWWRLVQVGVDGPPWRASMTFTLAMPNKYSCPHPTCSTPGCIGNQVELEETGDFLNITWEHHKSISSQTGVGSGPICQYPPKTSMTAKFTVILVETVLPHLYSVMGESVPDSEPLPMPPNVWSTNPSGQLQFKRFQPDTYGKIFKAVCLGSKCFKPVVHGNDVCFYHFHSR